MNAIPAFAIRARRRPRTLLALWVWELACALVIATPVSAWTSSVWGAHPDGDAIMFRPGGYGLVSWLFDEGPALAIVLRSTLVLRIAALVLGQLVTGAVIAALALETEDKRSLGLGDALRVGARSYVPLAIVTFVTALVETVLVALGLLAAFGANHSLQTFGDAEAFRVELVIVLAFVLVAAVFGVFADLVRVALVRDRLGFRSALRAAVNGALRRAVLGWTWRAVLAFALIVTGVLASDFVGARGGALLWALFFAHQAMLFGRAGLRVSWLAAALRLTP